MISVFLEAAIRAAARQYIDRTEARALVHWRAVLVLGLPATNIAEAAAYAILGWAA